jgi:hypothetical protein
VLLAVILALLVLAAAWRWTPLQVWLSSQRGGADFIRRFFLAGRARAGCRREGLGWRASWRRRQVGWGPPYNILARKGKDAFWRKDMFKRSRPTTKLIAGSGRSTSRTEGSEAELGSVSSLQRKSYEMGGEFGVNWLNELNEKEAIRIF